MKFDFPRKIRSGYFVAFVLLLCSYFLSITSLVQLKEQNEVVDHTQEVITKLGSLDSYLKDAEISWATLVLTQDNNFLLPLAVSRKRLDSVCDNLNQSVRANPAETESVRTLRHLIDMKYRNIREYLRSFNSDSRGWHPGFNEKWLQNTIVKDSIDAIARQLITNEQMLLHNRLRTADVYHKVVVAIMIGTGLLSILIILYSLITFNIESKAKREARQEAEQYHTQLEQRIVDLDRANRELIELRGLEKFTSTGRIARVIAHEVRNPLTNIDLSAGHLENHVLNPTDRKTFLDIINRNSKRINQLINELLTATKFSELQYERVGLSELLDDTLAQAVDRARLKKVTIEKKYWGQPVWVNVDRDRMKIALLNLMVNAIESMPAEKGLLQLETECRGDHLRIFVRDNGQGMDAETLSRIFEPYYTSKSNGNGLGLTNTQNIILNHKGKIEANSTPGKGTEFVITLQVFRGKETV